MIKTLLLNMSVEVHRNIYEDLLNRAKTSRDVKIMEAKDNWSKDSHLNIFIVYEELDNRNTKAVPVVKLQEDEFPQDEFPQDEFPPINLDQIGEL